MENKHRLATIQRAFKKDNCILVRIANFVAFNSHITFLSFPISTIVLKTNTSNHRSCENQQPSSHQWKVEQIQRHKKTKKKQNPTKKHLAPENWHYLTSIAVPLKNSVHRVCLCLTGLRAHSVRKGICGGFCQKQSVAIV